MRMERIGRGMSREVFLSENGIVIKKPRYSYYYNGRGCGSCNEEIFYDLIDQTDYDSKVKKVKEMLKEGRQLFTSARNTFVEYMVSLMLTEEEKEGFAVCFDIRVRRSSIFNAISVVGFYENALTKSINFEINNRDVMFATRTGFVIDDLHYNNYVNYVIVDYAMIGDGRSD